MNRKPSKAAPLNHLDKLCMIMGDFTVLTNAMEFITLTRKPLPRLVVNVKKNVCLSEAFFS
ncbi:MAG: hypothetical protein FWD19_03925 [Defluviitaleaceae bacterium]|nr:hypothetical protein [Defluviitaleaceae bacterium]